MVLPRPAASQQSPIRHSYDFLRELRVGYCLRATFGSRLMRPRNAGDWLGRCIIPATSTHSERVTRRRAGSFCSVSGILTAGLRPGSGE